MTNPMKKLAVFTAGLSVLIAIPVAVQAQETRSTMSSDWANSEDFSSENDQALREQAALNRYLVREDRLGNTVNIDGDYVNNTTNTGPVTSSSAMNVGQYSSNNLEVGDNSMATVTIGTDQTGDQQQEATSTVHSTGNTSNVYPN